MIITVGIRGWEYEAFVDSGCSQTIVSSRICSGSGSRREIMTVDGHMVSCQGEKTSEIRIDNSVKSVRCLIMDELACGFDVKLV